MGTKENIRRLRLLNNMTQHELGQAIGVSGMAISQYENGYSSPRVGKIKAMAKVFGVDPSEIVAEEIEQVRDSNIQHWLSLLNSDGKKQAVEYLEMLANNPKYSR